MVDYVHWLLLANGIVPVAFAAVPDFVEPWSQVLGFASASLCILSLIAAGAMWP